MGIPPKTMVSAYPKYVCRGGAYNKGRNAAKRRLKVLRKQGRAIQVKLAQAAGKKAPKHRPLEWLKFA